MHPSHLSRLERVALAVAAVGILFSSPSIAAEPNEKKAAEFFQSNELNSDVALSGRQFYIPTVFGPTGMNGWMLGETLVVREVDNGSPADGIVLTNDIISSVNGKPLGAEPLKAFGRQIEPSERTGKMELLITRAGKQKKITLPIRKLGALSKDWPFDCAKSRAIHLDACEYLARIQNHDGLFDGKIYVGFALNGLTWLASEDPRYMENARRLAYGYRKDFDPEAVSTINWEWAYMGVFLAEYYLQTGDETVRPLCQEIAQSLAQSQQPTGTWGHGSYPGLGYVQGGSLNNCGLVCWLALVLIDEAGVPVDQQALAKATHFFSRFTHRGGVPYGDHRPEFGGGNGKNAIPGVVLNILGDQAGSEYYARLVTGSYRGRTGGHTGGFMGFIWGNVQGARNPHRPDYRRMVDHWQWLLDVSRRWDGGFLLPESVIGKIYTYRGPVLSTGGVAQLYAMPNRVLRIHGGPKSVFATQELPANLKKGIELYRSRQFDELRQTVKPDSDHARQLLAAADRAEKDLELSFAKLESAITGRDFTLARRVWTDLDRLTRGEHPRRGSYNWRINTTEGAADVAAAEKLYRRHKWLTYTSPAARDAFERMAADPKAGIYQTLARRELATPDDSPLWAFFCELLWKEDSLGWQIDDQARAAALRVADMPCGNWPKIAALNDLYAAGILTERLKNWTPLVPANTAGYPGEKLTWRMLSVPRAEVPPADWTTVDFDDSEWDSSNGPLVSGKETDGMRVEGGGTPYIRIAFDCDRTDYDALVLVLRLLKATKAVAYLNGRPILWSDALQGPRMHIVALATIPLEQEVVGYLRKGRNVLAVRVSGGNGADFGLYASTGGDTLAFQPRPKDWAPGPIIGRPDLSTKTAGRPQLETVLAPNTTGLVIDPPGKPNDALTAIRDEFLGVDGRMPLGTTPIAERAKYLGHIDSRIRRTAAYSLMAEGAEAMPYILTALDSKDIRVIRAGCDALAGSFGMNGLGKGNFRSVMTSDIAGQAVPKLLPLLKHEDLYVREGALLALSNCGEAAAQHLDEIILAADDEDWWVRAGVSHVLKYVEEPETQGMAAGTIRNFLKEESTFGRNRLRQSLVAMAQRGHNVDLIVEALMIEASDEHGFYKGMAKSALSEIGANAKAAAPLFEEQLKEAKERLANADTADKKTQLQRTVDSLEGTLRKMKPEPIKIYLMAGQSNVEGHNYFGQECTNRYPGIDLPRDDVWCIYAKKISGPLRPGFGGGPGADNVFGPELVMGRILGEAVDNPIILFKSATGGTQLHTRWRPPSAVERAGGEVGDLYQRMMRRFHRFLANPKVDYPQYDGREFEIAGFVWFQGENDSLAEEVEGDRSTGFWNYYEENLRDLIHDVRTELAVPELPVLIIQIGPAPVWNRKGGGDAIRAAQKKVAEEDDHATWISTMDLHPKAHYNTPGMVTIGERAGKAMLPFAKTTVAQNNAATLKAGERYTVRPEPVASTADLDQLKKGLVAYWSFDEADGDTARDHAGEADGTLVGNPMRLQGVRGRCVRLVDEQHIRVPDYEDVLGPSGNIENLTVSYWYRTNYYGCGRIGKGVGKEVEYGPSTWYYSLTANVAGWDTTCKGTKGGVFMTVGCDGGTKGFKFNGGPGNVISDGFAWHHAVAIYDGSQKTFDIYIDGIKAPKGGKKSKDSPCAQLDKPFWGIQDENHILPAKDAILTIGEVKKIDRQFEAFDEVGIWSRPLTERQVLELYNNGHGVSLAN